MKILVIDIGGSHVKCVATDQRVPIRFKSGPQLSPEKMLMQVRKATKGWRFDAVSIGYPGVVRHGMIARDPYNLGAGWVGFNFHEAFGRPVKLINDAAMQALGGYEGGTMLFLGLGTGLGSVLIVDGVIFPMELGHMLDAEGRTYEDYVGEQGRRRMGTRKWRAKVKEIVESFRKAFLPDYTMLGGGNVAHFKKMPPLTRPGDNAYAFLGGFRMWEPHAVNVAAQYRIVPSNADWQGWHEPPVDQPR